MAYNMGATFVNLNRFVLKLLLDAYMIIITTIVISFVMYDL
jgi:hypothetical protein